MKNTLILLFLLVFSGPIAVQSSHAAVSKPSPLPAAVYNMPLRDFMQLKPRAMATVTGQRFTLQQRVAFMMMKPSMKKAITKNPAITMGEYFAAKKKMKTWLKVLLIVGGVLLLAFIIFAIAYGAGSE